VGLFVVLSCFFSLDSLVQNVILNYVLLWRRAMRVTSKGQVTIPGKIRRKLGITSHSEVEFVEEGNTVVLRQAQGAPSRGKRIVETLRGRATVKMTTEEIMALTRGDE
jgi:AbrB family looped-hinge helix DNA binding protein